MSINRDNFQLWYKGVLETLYSDQNAGFVILIVTFPLLERYLREKSGIHENDLSDPFYVQLRAVFPVLRENEIAKKFYHVYRNGLLHQVALSQKSKDRKDRKGTDMPEGRLSNDVDMLTIDSPDVFSVHPVKFSKRVVDVIVNDFSIFEAVHSPYHPLPVVDGDKGTRGLAHR